LLQTACNPLLAVDVECWKMNRNSDAFGHFPITAPKLQAKDTVTRQITIFNDDLEGENLELVWELREGSTGNWIFDKGTIPLVIQPGFSKLVPVCFRTPRFNSFVFLTLKVTKAGSVRFNDTSITYEIVDGEEFRSDFNGEERKFK
jgi:hypothetical protein